MPPGKAKLHLGDSWVVEGDDDYIPQYSPPQDEDDYQPPPRRTTPPRKSTRGETRSSEPDLVMPNLHLNSLDGSWAADTTSTTSRSARTRANQSAETILEARRRDTRTSNAGPTKDTRFKGLSEPSRSNQDDSSSFKALAVMSWLLDVLTGALRVLKTPLSYFLAVWLLFGIAVVVRTLVADSIYASMSPLCRVPGASLLSLPFCPVHQVGTAHVGPLPVEFDDLMSVQSKFEEVMEKSASGVSLPLDMKRGEASIRDLRQLVRYSQLLSKNELVLEFDGFIETARIASYDLQRFNSRVGGAVDSVIATTRWTTRVLDSIQERDVSRGSIKAFINDRLLAPFQPVKFTESILLNQYIQHTRIVEEEINKLIIEAQAILMVLINLEERLDVIHGITTRDDVHTKALREEILAELWTMLGGNRGKLNQMDQKLNLLQQVGICRKTAYAHVSGTIIRLQAIGAGLEDLRERVGSPELLRDRTDIPLSVHIEKINRGVERLEGSRLSARKLEDEYLRRTLEPSRLEGGMIDG